MSFYEDAASQDFDEPGHSGGPRANLIGNVHEEERVVPGGSPEFPQAHESQDGEAPGFPANQVGNALEETQVVPVVLLPESPYNEAGTMPQFLQNHDDDIDDSHQLVEEIQYPNHPGQSPDNPTTRDNHLATNEFPRVPQFTTANEFLVNQEREESLRALHSLLMIPETDWLAFLEQ